MRTTSKRKPIESIRIISKGLVRINMDGVNIDKYRELTKYILCALRNYEMCDDLNERSYALTILSKAAHSALDAYCSEASNYDLLSMNSALKKVQQIIKHSPKPSFFMQTDSRVLH